MIDDRKIESSNVFRVIDHIIHTSNIQKYRSSLKKSDITNGFRCIIEF